MLSKGMDAVEIQDTSTSPQCIQQTENRHGNQEEFETLGDRIKRIFKNILCGNKPELTTNLKVEVSEEDHFQVRVENDKTNNVVNVFVLIPRYFHFQRFESSDAAKCFDAIIFRDLSNPKTIQTSGKHANDINADAASKLLDDGQNLTLNCDLIAQLTGNQAHDALDRYRCDRMLVQCDQLNSKSLHNLTKTQLSTDRNKYVGFHDDMYADGGSPQPDYEKSASHTHKQPTSELLKDIENLEHYGDLTSGLPDSDKKSAYHSHKQIILVFMKDTENQEHHRDLTSGIPANVGIIANAQLQFTSKHITDGSTYEQLPVVSTKYAECKNHFSNIESESDIKDSEDHTSNQEISSDLFQRAASAVGACDDHFSNIESESDIKDSEDHTSNQQISSDLFQRAASAVGACDEQFSDIESESDIKDSEDHKSNQQIPSDLFQRATSAVGACDDSMHLPDIEKTKLLSDLNPNYVGLEIEIGVDRSGIKLDEGTASALTALYESELESDLPVTKVHSSSNGTCVMNGIPLMQSTFVFKRNKKAKQEVKFSLFGNNFNQLYTHSAALTEFQNYEISTKDFKIMRFIRRDYHDIFEVFETQEPYKGKMNDLIQILKQLESDTSQQLQARVPLQPSEMFDSKLGSSSSLPVDKWTDKVVSQTTKSNERSEFTFFARNKSESLGNTSFDKTNIPILKEKIRICETPTKTKTTENMSSSKEIASDTDIRKSISKSRNVSSTHRTPDPMLTSRRKMVDAKVKKNSKYKAPKINIFTTLDDDETGISTVLKDDIVRQALYGWFNNEPKIQFQRPSIPWPSMHPLLPYKLRYLDEGLVDNPVVKTTSSPNDSTDENE